MSLYSTVLAAIFIAAAVAFVTLFFVVAPYGRYLRGGWGVALTARRAWFIMEFPAALSIFLMMLAGGSRDPIALLFLALWEIHYLYRSILYPLLLKDNRSRSMPYTLILMAILYNCANGYVNGHHLFVAGHEYTQQWLLDPRFVIGMALFVGGFVIHVWSDRILQGLREPGEHAYRIPRGGMFRYVSSPNYLGEIVQWTGFAVATWSLAGLSFAVFTIANLLPRALSNHQWYQDNFDDYPEHRKAIVPFVL
jgi:3-oxo-5-alpha-steroid 4-dehydrogenase 1